MISYYIYYKDIFYNFTFDIILLLNKFHIDFNLNIKGVYKA